MQLPKALLQSLPNIPNYDAAAFEAVHQSKEQVTSIRVNKAKVPEQEIVELPIGSKVPWANDAFYLTERPTFVLNPLWHSGCFYVQDACSMFLEQALKQLVNLNQPLKVLDLCAAPGGKSTHIASLINEESFLVSNEIITNRNAILQENTIKWGSVNVVVTQNEAKDFGNLKNYFDVIVVDAPCSGSGLFRKDENAIAEWSENNVLICASRQEKILEDIWPSLKENGILIYSTCSYSVSENEDIMDWVTANLGAENVKLNLQQEWCITETVTNQYNVGYRFWPYLLKGEGFFISSFRKNSETQSDKLIKGKKLELISSNELALIHNYFINEGTWNFIKQQTQILALPKMLFEELNYLKQFLYIRLAGVTIGEIVNQKLLPNHHLATGTIENTFGSKLKLTKEQSLAFLRKEEFELSNAPIGWNKIQYQNNNLGFIKNMGNRFNNYYPKNWRILKRVD